jgi:hypothetical protein
MTEFNIFEQIAQAQELRNTTYFGEGHYIVRISNTLIKKDRHGLDIGIIETIVMDSTNHDITEGREVSWVCKLQGNDIGIRDLKTQFLNIVRCPKNAVTPALIKDFFVPKEDTGSSKLAGRECYVFAYQKTSPKTGSIWTKVDFRGIEEGDIIPNFDKLRQQAIQMQAMSETENLDEDNFGAEEVSDSNEITPDEATSDPIPF